MAERFLTDDLVTGERKLQEALVTSSGAGDAGKIPALDAAGLLDDSLMPAGIGAATVVLASSENLAAGDFVNFWEDTTLKVRMADADNGRPANGFVKAAVTSPANATVYPLGELNTNLSGLTLGAVYFLSDTPGGVTDDISAYANGDIVQRIGVAVSTTAILTEQNIPATIAAA
jgi:hypothetical protein